MQALYVEPLSVIAEHEEIDPQQAADSRHDSPTMVIGLRSQV